MKWRKLGHIYTANFKDNVAGIIGSAGSPIPMQLDNSIFRIFTTIRDEKKRGHVLYIDYNIERNKIISTSTEFSLSLGKRGCFDDNGVFLSSILRTDANELKAYYVGFDVGAAVRFNSAIGMATSKDNGKTFVRDYEGPIIAMDKTHPYFCTAPFVIFENDIYKMWFIQCHDWKYINDNWYHYYNVEYMESMNGIDWQRNDTVAITFQDEYEYALARPVVLKDGDTYKMWFSSRATKDCPTYRIRYAESKDGIHWVRTNDPKDVGIDVSSEGWDSEMICYPYVFDHNGSRYMFYNGNGYGRTGFGLAVLEQD